MSKERDINKVTLVGRLGNDPKYRPGTTNSVALASISVYTTFRWKEQSGNEWKEKRERHNVVFFNGLAEYARDNLRKGARVYIDGRLQTRKYQDNRTQLDQYITEVIAVEVSLLGQVNAGDANASPVPSHNTQTETNNAANGG